MSTRIRTAILGLATVTVAALGVAAAPVANAAARDGVCQAGEFCYYYNSDWQGSVSDFSESVADYNTTQPECYDFKGAGAGQGQCIKNNAASAWNRATVPVTVYFNTNYGGTAQTIAAGGKVNLVAALKNNNASHRFGATTALTRMSWALYEADGRLTCGFDGYTTTSGRHEGIDFARGIGAPVHSLVSGTVTNIVRGSNGSGGLSTIAIYNASVDKTVIYLHSAPLSGLSVGQSIGRGQQVAVEGWRGISSSGNYHTHVEMRPGRQLYASKSVGDPVLNNPNPTSFWNSQGYRVG